MNIFKRIGNKIEENKEKRELKKNKYNSFSYQKKLYYNYTKNKIINKKRYFYDGSIFLAKVLFILAIVLSIVYLFSPNLLQPVLKPQIFIFLGLYVPIFHKIILIDSLFSLWALYFNDRNEQLKKLDKEVGL